MMIQKTGKHFDFEWEAVISGRLKGQGCPYLAKNNQKVWLGFNDFKNSFGMDTNSFNKMVLHDNQKNDFCLKNNIAILRIPHIYDPKKDKKKIQQMVRDFISTKNVPQEIINFYEKYDFNNYAEVARKLNNSVA